MWLSEGCRLANEKQRAYYRRVARSVGVPEFWLDDAVQDIALDLWRRKRRESPYAVRLSAIDAVRRYGPYGRWGGARPTLVPLEHASDVAALDGIQGIPRDEFRTAVVRAARRMTELERRALERRLSKRPMSNAESLRASAARRKLRLELEQLERAS
jgi:hypothetical protein